MGNWHVDTLFCNRKLDIIASILISEWEGQVRGLVLFKFFLHEEKKIFLIDTAIWYNRNICSSKS